MNHEPPGRGADEVKGITRDQRELAAAARLHHSRVVRIDDFGRFNDVLMAPGGCVDLNAVSWNHAFQRAEEGVAMRGDDDVAVATRRRGAGDMSGTGDERPILDPLQNHHGDAKARHLEAANQVSLSEIGVAGGGDHVPTEAPRGLHLRDASVDERPAGVHQHRCAKADEGPLNRLPRREMHVARRAGTTC